MSGPTQDLRSVSVVICPPPLLLTGFLVELVHKISLLCHEIFCEIVEIPRDNKNGQKHKKSSTDVGLWKIQFFVKTVKSLIIVLIKSLVNWNEVSRGFCGYFLPTGAARSGLNN